jgi:hypothetical protein
MQVHCSPEQPAKLVLHGEEAQPRRSLRSELNEHVDVAIRAEVVAQGRAEDGQAANTVLPAEFCESLTINRHLERHEDNQDSTRSTVTHQPADTVIPDLGTSDPRWRVLIAGSLAWIIEEDHTQGIS